MVDDKQGFISQSAKVSVVLPTYNHLEFLPTAIHGILKQTYTDFELIIVNDGSTDGTREYLDNLKDPRIRVIHQENKRLPEALNTGFRAARGELLTWVSSDNYCAPIFIEALLTALNAFPQAGLACSAYARIDEHDRITCISRDQDLSYHSVLAANPGIVSFLYRRDCQEKVGMYDPELEGAEDWDMWIRIIEQFQTVYVPEVLYYYRLHSESMTNKIPEKVFRAGRRTFQKAISRLNNQLKLEDLYPTLELCRDKETAKLYALFDLGTAFLKSPLTQVEFACKAFENILSISQDSFKAAGNLAVAYGRAGKWEKLVPLLRFIMQRVENPKALEICRIITESYQRNKPDLLAQIPLFTLDKQSIELFQLEKENQLVFSFTNNDQQKDVTQYRGKSQVNLETSKQLIEEAHVKNQYQGSAYRHNNTLKYHPHKAELWDYVPDLDQETRNLKIAQKAFTCAQFLNSSGESQRKSDNSGQSQSTTACLRESQTAWELNKIPKRAYFYWGNETISFLRYLTVYSFRKLNPDWEINIFRPSKKYKGKIPWETGEFYDGVNFRGKDYTQELFGLDGIYIKEVDFSSYPLVKDAPENYKSDLFRWYILSQEGGLYSDIDILYFRPMNDLFFNSKENENINAAICLQKYGHIIGFLLSSQDNPFFTKLLSSCENAFDSKNYQSLSAPMVNNIYPTMDCINEMFPDLVFHNMPMNVVYAIDHFNIPAIFYLNDSHCLTPETIGIHWYAGNMFSQEFNNELTHENLHSYDNLIVQKIKEIYP